MYAIFVQVGRICDLSDHSARDRLPLTFRRKKKKQLFAANNEHFGVSFR